MKKSIRSFTKICAAGLMFAVSASFLLSGCQKKTLAGQNGTTTETGKQNEEGQSDSVISESDLVSEGIVHFFGSLGYSQDYKKAYDAFAKATAKKKGEAFARLADFYEKGIFVKQDYGKAAEMLQKASENGYTAVASRLASLYEKGGVGLEKNAEKSSYWAKKAEELTSSKKALDLVLLKAESGDLESQLEAGNIYLSDAKIGELGLASSVSKAIFWFESAASKNSAEAYWMLGQIYDKGYVGSPDEKRAYEYFQKASNLSHPEAICRIGEMYESGIVVDEDITKAFELYKKAAEAGSSKAACYVGNIYNYKEVAEKFGVKKNTKEAAIWYKKAAEKGDQIAKKMLEDLK